MIRKIVDNVDVYFKPTDRVMWLHGYNDNGDKIFAVKVEDVFESDAMQTYLNLNKGMDCGFYYD